MEELLEEYGDKIIRFKKCNMGTFDIVIDGKKTSPKEIRQIRKAFEEKKVNYNLTVKGSGE